MLFSFTGLSSAVAATLSGSEGAATVLGVSGILSMIALLVYNPAR